MVARSDIQPSSLFPPAGSFTTSWRKTGHYSLTFGSVKVCTPVFITQPGAEMERRVTVIFASQTGPAEAVPGAAEEAGSPVARFGEEHYAQPAPAGPAPHKGEDPSGLSPRRESLSSASESGLSSRLAEAAGAGRAGRAAEGPPALAAEGAAGSAGAAAERLGEDEERQPRLVHVLGEVGFGQR